MNYVPDVILAMRNEAIAGNHQAAKIFLDYVGELEGKSLFEGDDYDVDYEEVKMTLKKLRLKKV